MERIVFEISAQDIVEGLLTPLERDMATDSPIRDAMIAMMRDPRATFPVVAAAARVVNVDARLCDPMSTVETRDAGPGYLAKMGLYLEAVVDAKEAWRLLANAEEGSGAAEVLRRLNELCSRLEVALV